MDLNHFISSATGSCPGQGMKMALDGWSWDETFTGAAEIGIR